MTVLFLRVQRLLIWLHWTFWNRSHPQVPKGYERWAHAIAHRDAWRWWKRAAYACGVSI